LKSSKTSHSDCSTHVEDDIMQNLKKKEKRKKKVKKSKKPRFCGQNKLLS
jgi:hypothetical protein